MAGSSRPASSQAAPKEDEDEDLDVSPCNETVGGGGRGAFNTWPAARDVVEDANPLVREQVATMDPNSKKRWKKALYGGMQPGFPDNYTDPSFLEAMVMNAHVVKRDLWTVMQDSVAISQYVCVVSTVASVWTLALNSTLESYALLLIDALVAILGSALLFTVEDVSLKFVYKSVFNLTCFVSGLYVMTPILETLTRSISSDSILASVICLLIVHLFFHDYSCSNLIMGNKQQVKHLQYSPPSVLANISLHSSIVASVLVASRLPSRLLVFAVMLFSLEFFLLFPLVSHCIRCRSRKMDLLVSCSLMTMTVALVFSLSRLLSYFLFGIITFITILCPIWLINIQEYKFEINGPWDEAKLCFDID